jgi:hypothetical protein
MEGLNHLLATEKGLLPDACENAVFELFTFGMAMAGPSSRVG